MSTRYKPLGGADVLALYRIVKSDRRVDKYGRMILAEIARSGHPGKPAALAKAIRLNAGAVGVTQRIDKLIEYGYLPTAGRR